MDEDKSTEEKPGESSPTKETVLDDGDKVEDSSMRKDEESNDKDDKMSEEGEEDKVKDPKSSDVEDEGKTQKENADDEGETQEEKTASKEEESDDKDGETEERSVEKESVNVDEKDGSISETKDEDPEVVEISDKDKAKDDDKKDKEKVDESEKKDGATSDEKKDENEVDEKKDENEAKEDRDGGKEKSQENKENISEQDKSAESGAHLKKPTVTQNQKECTPDKITRSAEKEQSSGKSKSSLTSKGSSALSMRPMATMLFDVGMDLARQQVYKDLIRIQSKKQSMDKLDDKEARQLDKLKEAYDDLVDKNEPFACEVTQCDTCGYKTEVNNVMENHLEYGHGQSLGLFQCSICDFETKMQHQYIVHMDRIHGRKGRILVRHAFFVCPFCPFEHNAKHSFNKHIIKCERLFKLERNLEPTPADCDIPIKMPKQPTLPASKPQNKPTINQRLANNKRQIAPNQQVGIVANAAAAAMAKARAPVPRQAAPNQAPQMVQVGSQWYNMIHLNGQRFLTPVVPGVSVPNVMVPSSGAAPVIMQTAQKIAAANKSPALGNAGANNLKSSFEICEICGGFVKDRDSLRIHFYWAHKVDIHKDVFAKKNPNLTCDHCSFRCWTTQGLMKHRTSVHKDQTKNKDKSRMPFYCMLCRPTPELLHTETFWLHMFHQHDINPDNIFKQTHCVVCGVANIGVANALETHMFNIHAHLFAPDLMSLARKLALKPGDLGKKNTGRKSSSGHVNDNHKDEKEECPLCKSKIQVGRPFVRHMKSEHLKECSLPLQRLSQELYDKHIGKYIETYGELERPRKTPSKRKRQSDEGVIVLDETPQKKAREEKEVIELEDSENKDTDTDKVIQLDDSEKDTDTDKVIQLDDSENKDTDTDKAFQLDDSENKDTDSDKVIELDGTNDSDKGEDKSKTKEVIEFDGEEFVVELQENDDEEESPTKSDGRPDAEEAMETEDS